MVKYYDMEASPTAFKTEDDTYEYEYGIGSDIDRIRKMQKNRKSSTTYGRKMQNIKNESASKVRSASELKRKTNAKNKNATKKDKRAYDSQIVDNVTAVYNKEVIKKHKIEKKKNIVRIIDVSICFCILMLISYRYATIDANFRQKENLKKELASIQKENEQLKVNIEQQMNFNAIEQEAKEKLGMQKLDNNQKVYVNLNKSDYIEPSANLAKNEEQKEETWWSKLLKDLFKIEN